MARSKLHQKRLRSPFFKVYFFFLSFFFLESGYSFFEFQKQKNSSNNGQGSIQNIDRAPSSPEFAAQNSTELGSRGAGSDEPARILKRPRLPKKFLDAVAHLGIKNAVPKTIMQLKNDDGDNNGGGGNKNKKKDSYLEHLDLSSPKLNVVSEDLPISIIDLELSSSGECSSGECPCGEFNAIPWPSSKLWKEYPIKNPLADFPTLEKRRTKKMADADGDANNDGGDDRDNNGGGGDKNKKQGGGSGDGEGNGDGGDKADGGDGEEKGMNKDCTGQLGFGYRCTYHAGYENGYPVEQLHALIIFYLFCSENMMNYCSIMPPVRDVSLMNYCSIMPPVRDVSLMA